MKIYPDVAYRGYESGFRRMLSLGGFDEESISSRRYTKEFPVGGRFSMLIHYVYSAMLNVWILLTSQRDALLVYNFNNVFSTFLLNFLNHFLNRRIVVFCHGEMEFLVNKVEGSGHLAKIICRLVISFFKKEDRVHKTIFYSVCGDKILSNLLSNISSKFYDQFISVDHPYICNVEKEYAISSPRSIRMGLVGALSEKKGLADFLKFVKVCKESRFDFEFSITGSGSLVKKDVFEDLDIAVPRQYPAPVSPLEFEARVRELDVILFFYPTTSYKATASGALYDAINARKIILGIDNDYFNYVFDKFGTFGILCRSVDDMLQKLPDIVQTSKDSTVDFGKIQRSINPFSLAEQLKERLINKGVV